MEKMDFTEYDRITDCLMYLSDAITLNFTVMLSRKDKTGGRMFYHSEMEQPSKFYQVDKSRSIKRYMFFFYSIDNKNDFGNALVLKPKDVAILNMVIQQKVIPWFFGQQRIFQIVKNGDNEVLAITGNFTKVPYIQSEYKFLMFEPIVLTYENNANRTYKEGIRITLNASGDYAEMDIDTFLGFQFILKNTDMYSVAANLTTYCKVPPYGVNVYRPVGLGAGKPDESGWQQHYTSDTKTPGNNGKNNFLDSAKKKE